MTRVSRRSFLAAGAATATFGCFAADSRAEPADSRTLEIRFVGDGPVLSPAEYGELLVKLAQSDRANNDLYLKGGAVEELESRFAAELGKERAIFVPTGTLANHLAVRRLAGERSRVLVQAESHLYCDAYDCAQTLSHLNLVPLVGGRATYTVVEVEEACNRAKDGPHPVPVGALSIECPVRRRLGELFDFDEMKRITAFARKQRIGTHLDGARLYIAAAYSGISIREYAALFDTVYISLYKYLGAASGAILAGPSALIEPLARDRMVFGGGLFQAWPFATVALHFLEGFADRFQKARAAGDALIGELEKHSRFRVERIPHGTNISKLRVEGVDANAYSAALRKRGIVVAPRPGEFTLTVNETLLRRPVAEIARAFEDSLPQ
jgi:threonine aldolase